MICLPSLPTPRLAALCPSVRTDARRLALVISTHVDDLKGAGEEEYRQKLISELERKFDKLKVKLDEFECIGVKHEQDPDTK